MLVKKMTEYDVFTEALSNSKNDTSIIVPRTKVIDFLKICVTNCIGNKYKFIEIDIDDEDWCDYVISFVDIDGVTDVFIEPMVNRNKKVYFDTECGVAYVDVECNNDVFSHLTAFNGARLFDTRY